MAKIDTMILKELQEIPYKNKREILTQIKMIKKRTAGYIVDALNKTSGSWKGLVDADRLKKEIYSNRLISTRSGASF
jgi:Holliday junction resolvasome RuvABC DNA-binding subunit